MPLGEARGERAGKDEHNAEDYFLAPWHFLGESVYKVQHVITVPGSLPWKEFAVPIRTGKTGNKHKALNQPGHLTQVQWPFLAELPVSTKFFLSIFPLCRSL